MKEEKKKYIYIFIGSVTSLIKKKIKKLLRILKEKSVRVVSIMNIKKR